MRARDFVLAAALAIAPLSAAVAQSPGDLPALLDDLVTANHILYHRGVLDGFGHVSVRSPARVDHFFMAAAVAPGLVMRDDILEFDLDGKVVGTSGRPIYSERFIHAEIYRARADAMAVVHSHSPTVVPFSVSQVPLKPILAQASFLSPQAPVFEIRKVAGMTNLLVSTPGLGKALAETLGPHPVVLMRGHGDAIVGPDIKRAVSRAIYTEINARLLWQALGLGGPITYISPEEAAKTEASRDAGGAGRGNDRAWDIWKEEARRAAAR